MKPKFNIGDTVVLDEDDWGHDSYASVLDYDIRSRLKLRGNSECTSEIYVLYTVRYMGSKMTLGERELYEYTNDTN